MPDRLLRRVAVAVSAGVLLGSLVVLTYFLERHETFGLIITYSLAFAAYVAGVRLARTPKLVNLMLGIAILGRLMLIPAMPNLSDDIYRFVWDGRLLQQGVNPFAYLPSEMIDGKADSLGIKVDQDLYTSLNSPDYYTIYPPINQAVFTTAVGLFPHSLRANAVVIRSVLLLAEIGTLWLLVQLAAGWGLPRRQVLWYALNPLAILEMTGNLHFEALMIFFLLGSVYLYRKKQLVFSALLFGLAVCTKLLPLMFLPLYLRRLGGKEALKYYAIVGATTVLLFAPLVSDALVQGLSNSIGLYFQKFEFNASIYYLVREVGYLRKGYNIIQTAGPQLALAALLAIVLYTWKERRLRLPESFGWVWLIYLLFALTIHPWYTLPLLAFTGLTSYRYAVAWTFFIFLTYSGYGETGFQENLGLVAIEYLAVLAWLGYELSQRRTI